MTHYRSAPAKVNLGLHVLRRRQDGYHEIETVFQPLTWADHVEAQASGGLSLSTSDPTLPTGKGNLVWRAAEALAGWAGIAPKARIYLDKVVPYGAGLGSGSSDAAATLLLLRDLWGLDVRERDLYVLAESLGADVPFFLTDHVAVGTGTGTDLEPLRDDAGGLWRCPFWLVVAVPSIHVSTAEAYAGIVPNDVGRPGLATAVASGDLNRWRREVTNDFEAPVTERHPEVAETIDRFNNLGAGWAALSGSGSSVVAAFENETRARAAGAAAEASGARVWVQPPEAPVGM